MNSKAIKRQLLAAIAMVLVAALALGSSTFAWFVNNTKVTATDVSVTASTAYSLLIKHYSNGTYGTTTPLNTGKVNLIPVSTIGGTSQDGIKFYKSDKWDANANVYTFADATVTHKAEGSDLTSEAYVSAENPGSPYYVDTVYFKAGQTSSLYFDSTTTGLVADTTSGEQTSGITKFSASDNELVKALRIGVLVSDKDGTNGKFYVFQLNSTESTNEANTTATTLTAASANGLNAGVASTTDTAAFTSDNIATFSSSSIPTLDASAVAGDAAALATAGEGAVSLYDFSVTGISNKEECKAVIYIWMEGCDEDTVSANIASFNLGIFTGLQLGFCLGMAS